jgi:hypothetical protein
MTVNEIWLREFPFLRVKFSEKHLHVKQFRSESHPLEVCLN